MSLSAAAESRKQRLEHLAALSKQEKDHNNEGGKRNRDDGEDHPKLNASAYIKPRNFDPDARVAVSGVGDIIIQENETLEKLAQEIETRRRQQQQESQDQQEGDKNNLVDINPNKQYQDLKKSLQPQLETLDAQTDNVIHSLVRQRIIDMKNER